MLYVVEMDFTQPARQAQWEAWYERRLDVLLAVPGFRTAQRFRCLTSWPAPYLAIYTVDSPAVFEGAHYRAHGGRESTGDWRPFMVRWDRNLFSGVDRAPPVARGELLLLTEAEPGAVSGLRIDFAWLAGAGLDATIPRRGLAVADEALGRGVVAGSGGRIRAYRPIAPMRTPDDVGSAGAS